MIPSKLVRGSDSSRGFFYTHSGKGGMPLCEIDADHVLDELADHYEGKLKIAKLNVDEHRATAVKYQVRSIPMLLLFKDGEIQATQIGAVGKGPLTQMIDKALGTAA